VMDMAVILAAVIGLCPAGVTGGVIRSCHVRVEATR